MSMQSIINSPLGIGIVLGIGKIIPPKSGFKLADAVADYIVSKPESDIVRAVRANQWVITGEKLSKKELDQQTEKTFCQIARCIYDLYHNFNNYQAILDRVTLTPKLIEFLHGRAKGSEGTILLGPHLSNFDFAGRALALHGLKPQVLSYPQPKSSYRWQNKLRREIGLDITPMSTENMRRAKSLLKAGGFVVTGLERPLAKTNYYPRFFGRPAPVPTSYVRMAMQTNSVVAILACSGTPEDNYIIDCSEAVHMKPYDDAIEEIERNAEKVLSLAEGYIQEHPTQWAMSYPVWPDVLDKMP